MRTDKTASHICYELDHDVQEYAKRLLAKKILHAVRQDNTASLPDEMAKKLSETAVFLTERLALLYELNSGFRGIRFSTFGEQPAVYTTMVQHNAPLYDELMLGRAYNLANYLAADNADIKESALMKHKVLAAIYSAAAHMKGQTPERRKISIQSQMFVSTAVDLFDSLLSATAAIKVPPELEIRRVCMIRVKKENHRSWFMSNYYPCEFVMNGIRYKNAEAAFQSHKVPLEERRQFAGMPPASAKRFGRNVAIPANWDEARDDVMRHVVMAKFEQNEDLKQRLLETGTQPIEEDTTSWHDNYWGNCHCPKCRNIPGQNRLGTILMETRDKLKKQAGK